MWEEAKEQAGSHEETEKEIIEMENMLRDLFNEWMLDFSFEEKQVWLWNAMVEMVKIRERRNKAASCMPVFQAN